MERHGIEGRQPHANLKTRSPRTNPSNYFAQKSRAIRKTAAVFATTCVGTKKFVSQIPMAVFNVNKIESNLRCHGASPLEVLDNRIDFAIAEHRILGRQAKSEVEHRMAVHDARLGFVMSSGTTIAPGMRQL